MEMFGKPDCIEEMRENPPDYVILRKESGIDLFDELGTRYIKITNTTYSEVYQINVSN